MKKTLPLATPSLRETEGFVAIHNVPCLTRVFLTTYRPGLPRSLRSLAMTEKGKQSILNYLQASLITFVTTLLASKLILPDWYIPICLSDVKSATSFLLK